MSSPAHKERIGNITAVIWRNSGERTWYSVQLSRGYKVDDGWRNTDSLGGDDIQTARKVLDMAHNWILIQEKADAKARKEQAA